MKKIMEVLFCSHWFPVKQRIQYKLLLHCYNYNALNSVASSYLKSLLEPIASEKDLHSSTKNLLEVPKTFIKFRDRAFRCSAPVPKNSLPEELKRISKLNTLK